jgi:hypothetical protein
MAGLEPARACYGPTDFKSVDFPRESSLVGNYLTNSASVHYNSSLCARLQRSSAK